MNWQPMNTAPNDATELLLYFKGEDQFLVGHKFSGVYWCATYQTGGEALQPDMWTEIEHPVKK